MTDLSHLRGKRILLIVTGGIAAYKVPELIRQFVRAGARVQAVLTPAAQRFVSPLSIAAVSGEEALTELFDLTREARIGHIELSRAADILLVAPASADFLARMAHGLADDLASTVVLATDKPVIVAPAMNVRMWLSPATRRNRAALVADGVEFIGPEDGDMACGEFGPGRMADPETIVARLSARFASRPASRLRGRHVIVTSGPTREPLDPVRYISNYSSGRQGTAIAEALVAEGARVTFVTGPAEAMHPAGCRIIAVETAIQMRDAVMAALPADAAIFAAAVADWRAADPAAQKLKKTEAKAPPSIHLVENPDILAEVAQLDPPRRPALVVGFAAETGDLIAQATAKRLRKGCDWILANDVSPGSGILGGAETELHLVTSVGASHWGRLSKVEAGRKIATAIAEALGAAKPPEGL